MSRLRRVFACAISLVACSGPPAPITGERAEETRVPTAPPPAAPAPSTVPTAAATVSPTATAAAPRTRTSPFPPAPRTPPHERTQKPGDGAWTSLPAGASASPLATTRIHPHKVRRDVEVDVVAIDLSRARLGFVLGTEEPESDAIAKDARPGTLPQADVARLLAAMNGGFKRRHGEHGAIVGNTVVVPPKPDACSLVSRGGALSIAAHKSLATDGAPIDFLRQGPPCLVEGGKKHPDTVGEYSAKKWGAAEDGKREIRRSAFGLSADRETLYFAIGDWVTAEWFADALVAVGIDAACQFDINWSYTRFVLYDHGAGGEPVASSPLLSKLKFSSTEYWKTPSIRDFFYLATR